MRLHLIAAVAVAGTVLGSVTPARAQGEVSFLRGEVNRDGIVDLSDAVSVIFHLFRPGFEIPCRKAADFNDSGQVDISDAIYALRFLFTEGPPPPAPFGRCGPDPTPDALDCVETPCEFDSGSVIISEVMALNSETLADEDGSSSDWIELHLLESSAEDVVDLGGWFLTDDPQLIDTWRIPDGVTIERGGFLIVFASGKDRGAAGSELHADFRLDSEGEYLALVAPDGVTVVDEFMPGFPEQLRDVSYGPAQSTTTLIGPGASVRYRVPTSADAGIGTGWTAIGFPATGWRSGATGLGFSSVSGEGFDVTYIRASVAVDHLSVAEQVLANRSMQARVVTERASVIDYYNTGGRGNYANDNPFPGIAFTDVNDFVVHVTGTVLIPSTGQWSFGVNSDDGFRLELSRGARRFTMSHPTPRGPNDTISVFNITEAGPYDIDLLFYERGGGAELELFAAPGNRTTFSPGAFRLVGDAANGGLGLLGFASDIRTDLASEMRNVNASLWTRIDFDVDDAAALGGLSLRMKYEDGFIAYLNGQEVARRNAPGSPRWNSSATADRPIEDVPSTVEINLTGHLGLLRNGRNVLAIHGLNDSSSDGDFLLQPELVAAGRLSERQYMTAPSPGTFNVPGAIDFVRRVEASVERGFFDGSFSLALSTPTEGARIRYTLDGSEPTATRGTIYDRPLTISETTVIRAAAFRTNHLDSVVTTRTYIFPRDVVRQSPSGQAPGPGWPTGQVNGQVLDYGMDPDIVNNARWSSQLDDALLQIPSISLATDLDNLFGSTTGIYVNARNDGRAWERRTSVELLNPDDTPGFGVDAGLRIRGAFSRSGGNPKHSLRLFFRSEYGAGRLQYALFGGEGVDEFDKIDLRTSQNYSWAFQGSSQNTFLRDVFSRDVQRDMGQPYTRSRYYHLYINGHYWGLYQTQERADAEFAQSYLGGRDQHYDVIKNDSSGSRALHATDGTMEAYRRLYDAAVAGFSSDAAYLRLLGLRSDGGLDPAGERLLDAENLMDYMICTYYTGDPDAPISAWAHFSNNVFAIYNRVEPDGFKWFRHDAEHSLGANGGLNEARLLTDPTDRSIGQEWRHFNPAWLHLRLTANEEYLMQFADRVNRYFTHDGLLAPRANRDRWLDRARQIDMAIIAESARWGDAKTHPPLTKDHWQAEVNSMVSSYFPQRTRIVLQQMRSVSMFPREAIVSFNRHGGEVEPGFRVLMTQGDGTAGTIYYTSDGSDPRLWGGGLNPGARVFSDDSTEVTFVPRGATWRYLDDGSNQGAAWRGLGFADGGWRSGRAQLGYGDGDEATVVEFGPDPNNKYPTTYFRRAFTVEDASAVVDLTLGIVRDDGAVVYINGVEAIPRLNMPAGPIDYLTLAEGPGVPVGGDDESTFHTFPVDPSLLRDGTNVVAVEIHQSSRTSTDISFDLELTGLTGGGGASPGIVIDRTTTVRARVRSGANWGAMTEARFTVGLEGLVINEIMAANNVTLEDPSEPGEFPDWIELYNGTSGVIDLEGMYLTDDLLDLQQWAFGRGVTIGPGEYLIVFADDDGTQGPTHTNYKLSKSGEAVALVDRDGMTIIDSIVFDGQIDDVSFGRFPDGGDTWGFHESATPGSANSPHAQ